MHLPESMGPTVLTSPYENGRNKPSLDHQKLHRRQIWRLTYMQRLETSTLPVPFGCSLWFAVLRRFCLQVRALTLIYFSATTAGQYLALSASEAA